jgi:undecaprenyl-diphosphatase
VKQGLQRIPHTLLQLLRRASTLEKSALIALFFAAASLFAFAELAEEVLEGETHAFDELILLALREDADLADPLGPPWLEETMRDFSALGSTSVLSAITLAISGLLLLTRQRHVALLVVGAVTGGVALSHLFKWGFDRPRPDLVPHLSVVQTLSFPSGHAMLSAVVYLTLGVLLTRVYADVRVKIYVLAVAAAATVVTGLSRVYLGVHWPTDVLAGWAIGAAWALCCWLFMLWLQWLGRVEPDDGRRDGG